MGKGEGEMRKRRKNEDGRKRGKKKMGGIEEDWEGREEQKKSIV